MLRKVLTPTREVELFETGWSRVSSADQVGKRVDNIGREREGGDMVR